MLSECEANSRNPFEMLGYLRMQSVELTQSFGNVVAKWTGKKNWLRRRRALLYTSDVTVKHAWVLRNNTRE